MKFSIETILTVLTKVAFEQGLDNAKQLVEYMTGEEATTLTFAMKGRVDLCQQEIVRQHPKLEPFVSIKNINKKNYQDISWLAIETIGDNELPIKPIEKMPTPEEYYRFIRSL